MFRLSLLFFVIGLSLAAQQPPEILAHPLDATRPFPGWNNLRGSVVVIDFWATWCGPCLPGAPPLEPSTQQ